jgi:hypothetical protein
MLMTKSLIVVLFVALGALAFQGGPSKDVRNRLYKQVIAEDAELRDCLKEQQGGNAPSEDEMTIEELDLNRDGVKEYEVQLSGMCACGAHNCTIYLYRRVGQGFESILEENASGLGVELLKTATNGHTDIQVNSHGSAATEYRTVYKFDGKKYREANTTIVSLETGESKPAHRRVQFQRGSSSATVRGKASIVLPDTYLIGARAGQVMTVQLTAREKSVRFMVMTPKTDLIADNSRGWSGTLPETGDYTIIVDADELGGTYSMTITIK